MGLEISNQIYHDLTNLAKQGIDPKINTVSIDGKQYNIDTSNKKEMHLYNQLIALEKKMIIAKYEFEQLDVAYQVFAQHLLKSVNSKEEEQSEDKEIVNK